MAFFIEYPIGWQDDLRMLRLIEVVGGIAGNKIHSPEKLFPTLKPIFNQRYKHIIDNDSNQFSSEDLIGNPLFDYSEYINKAH